VSPKKSIDTENVHLDMVLLHEEGEKERQGADGTHSCVLLSSTSSGNDGKFEGV